MFSYYDNQINLCELSSLINSNNEIEIESEFVFTSNGNLIYKNPYQFGVNSIISYPNLLPSFFDGYQKYVAGNLSSTNTGLQSAKQNSILNGTALLNNPLSFGIKALLMPHALGNDIAKNIVGLKQTQDSVYSAYENARRTLTSNFSPSHIIDASFILTHSGISTPEEVFQHNILNKEYIKNVNNIFFRYGFLFPMSEKLKNLFTRTNFNYIEFNNGLIENKVIQNSNENLQTKQLIISQLKLGIRF